MLGFFISCLWTTGNSRSPPSLKTNIVNEAVCKLPQAPVIFGASVETPFLIRRPYASSAGQGTQSFHGYRIHFGIAFIMQLKGQS